jgi:hypothetical protein
MNTSSIIPVHSFVDLITNSSSEIFVAANKGTVKAIKNLVDSIIGAASNGEGIGATADTLFTFELVYCCTNESYGEVYMNDAEIKAKRKEIKEILKQSRVEGGKKYTEEEIEGAENWRFPGDGDQPTQCNVKVAVKDPSNVNAKAAAKILSDLTSFFSIQESYN